MVEEAAMKFWDEIALTSERNARVVKILKDYIQPWKQPALPTDTDEPGSKSLI